MHHWITAGHAIETVWTAASTSRSDSKRHRWLARLAPQWSLSAVIDAHGITHRRVTDLRDPQTQEALVTARPDVIISVYFPKILPASLLARLTVPIVNLHPALLPAYRGPAPLIGMLLDDTAARYGGVTLHRLERGIDRGRIYASLPVPFTHGDHPRRWELTLGRAAARLAIDALPQILAGKIAGYEQDESLAFYRRPRKSELVIWPTDTAARAARLANSLSCLVDVSVALPGGALRVRSLIKPLGPPTGAAPRVGWSTIELDLADRRVRFRRWMVWHGRARRLATFLIRVIDRDRSGPTHQAASSRAACPDPVQR